ncbi:hypothetical protein OJAV_G00134500 [Oryzias javanicus]|uniref:Geminin coiled-coil domain-containing protein 1 n=1 Tax=Oryzias javanicus TaxID=123683 RepID=A0A3S2P2T3_ORYJA|nr:hypothetical protein OJAV_G00134500 [Oryzias javanicus]
MLSFPAALRFLHQLQHLVSAAETGSVLVLCGSVLWLVAQQQKGVAAGEDLRRRSGCWPAGGRRCCPTNPSAPPTLIRIPAGRGGRRGGGQDLTSVPLNLRWTTRGRRDFCASPASSGADGGHEEPELVTAGSPCKTAERGRFPDDLMVSDTPGSPLPREPSDPTERGGPACVWDSSPPAGWTWEQQFSPHLQRNKQLQDALLQREEELARLQEENSKLREFLSSSCVRNLQEKAEKLGVASHAALKRTRMTRDGETPPFSTHRLLNSKKVSKRVCRNLTAEFCSETPESPSEPNLDQWVLRTLGLKDRDTIDTSSPLVPDFSDWEEDSSSGSAFDSPVSMATPSSVHSCCRGGGSEPDHGFSAADPDTGENRSRSAGIGPLLNLTVHDGSHETRIRNFNFWTSFHSDGLDLQPMTASSSVRSPEPPFWSPPPPEPLTSTPTSHRPPPEVQTPRRCPDVAFSMLLRPSSSVRTHSFPQGQAFVRRDTGGRCDFTWVPR